MHSPTHVLVNGLSVGSGGGYSVARGIARHVAIVRPDWHLSLMLTAGVALHERMRGERLPANVTLHFAPASTRYLPGRAWYERRHLPAWTAANDVDAVVQLNGMVVPTLRVPTLAHFQDPWPYRPQAWRGVRDRLVAAFKRRAIRASLGRAAWCGFTSEYLRGVICGASSGSSEPSAYAARSSVFLNGLPRSFADRLREPLDDWSARPMEVLTVSDVADYKRQWLVVRAVAMLRARPEFATLTYRVIGRCDAAERRKLGRLAASLGVAGAVRIEGVVSDAAIHEAFGRARCFALMSVCESFGLPAIEAMSRGTPVVASACCATPEVCGDAAELAPVDDVDALAARLARVLSDAPHAASMRRRGRERVLRFDWLATAEQIARTLAGTCQRSSARPAASRRRGALAIG